MAEKIDLKGRRALILGADGETGRAAAVRLAGAGMKLALTGRDARALMRTAALTGRPLDMLVLPGDPAAERTQADILHILTGHFKGLEAVVNASLEDAEAAHGLIGRCLPLLTAGETPCVIGIANDASDDARAIPGVRTHRLARTDAPEAFAGAVEALLSQA